MNKAFSRNMPFLLGIPREEKLIVSSKSFVLKFRSKNVLEETILKRYARLDYAIFSNKPEAIFESVRLICLGT